jgi:hypothetical protein
MEILDLRSGGSLKSVAPYPSEGVLLGPGQSYRVGASSTAYGYSVHGRCIVNQRQVFAGEYFCLPGSSPDGEIQCERDSTTAVFIREGFVGLFSIGQTEEQGRVAYIDGCTDSVLVCPPRMGDPCLNFLHFPAGVRQSFHSHPTVRLGVVASGKGTACILNGDRRDEIQISLEPGLVFMLPSSMVHRFETTSGTHLNVIAYHPDSDWGPTDQNHPMLNRTYLVDTLKR